MNSTARTTIQALLTACVLSLTLVACSSPVTIPPAQHAPAAECAVVIVNLPDTLEGQPSRSTTSQSTAAWGDPAVLLFRCGLEMPVASDEVCFEAGGIDWLSLADDEGNYRFISYGRDPAVELIISADTQLNNRAALEELSEAVGLLTQYHYCSTLSETL